MLHFYQWNLFKQYLASHILSHVNLSHVNTKSLMIIFTQVLFSKNLSISQSLSHSQAYMLGFQAWCSLHIWVFIGPLYSHWHWSLLHFLFELHCLPSKVHLQVHGICFIDAFASFSFICKLHNYTIHEQNKN